MPRNGLLNQMFQSGGAGYARQRASGKQLTNLRSKGGLEKRDAWIAEVKAVQRETGMSYSDALHEASVRRQNRDPSYRTHKQRVMANYKPRSRSAVLAECARNGSRACPGAYDRPATSSYRPGRRNKRLMTEKAAVAALRKHYREMGRASGNMKSATRSMRADISRKRGRVLTPCPTQLDSRGRRVAVRTDECADSYLFRGEGARRYDMAGVDDGIGKRSPAYGKRLLRLR